jgi:hypothetical protein
MVILLYFIYLEYYLGLKISGAVGVQCPPCLVQMEWEGPQTVVKMAFAPRASLRRLELTLNPAESVTLLESIYL